MSRCDSCRYQNDFEFHACHICHMEKDMYKPKKTNFDRIRAMSVEELAAWIAEHPVVVAYDENNPQHKAWLEWLEKEADA